MRSDFSLLLVHGGASTELSDSEAFRAAISTGRLTRETVVTVLQAGEARRARAGDLDGLREAFDDLSPLPSPERPPDSTTAKGRRRRRVEVAPEPDASAEGEAPAEEPSGRDAAAPPVLAGEVAEPSSEPPPLSAPMKPAPAGPDWSTIVRRLPLPVKLAAAASAAILVVSMIGAAMDDPGPPPRSGSVLMYAERNVNVRAGPSRSAALAGELARGEALRGEWEWSGDGRWLLLSEGRHAGAYVWDGNLSRVSRPALFGAASDRRVERIAEVFEEPSTTGARLFGVRPGEVLHVLGETASGWAEIAAEGEGVGYVRAEAFELSPPVEMLEDLQAPPPVPRRPASPRPPPRDGTVRPPRPATTSGSSGPTVACVLPDGSEISLEASACRSRSGVILSF